jgi:acyl-CoA reductase-like NAD-dependent aldehyde dehydrogenase
LLMSTRPGGGEEVVCEIAVGTDEDVDADVIAAVSAFDSWRDQRPVARGRVMARIADALRAESVRLLGDWNSG